MQTLSPTLQIPEAAHRAPRSEKNPLMDERQILYDTQPDPDPRLADAYSAFEDGNLKEAGRIASKAILKNPRNADALNLLAEIAKRAHRFADAENFLQRCVRWAPEHQAYRYNYIVLLIEINKYKSALREINILLEKKPESLLYRAAKAHILNRNREYAEAAALFRQLSVECPNSAEVWQGLASTLRSVGGYGDEPIQCLRRALEIEPGAGSAWWGLAAMKTVRFAAEDVRIMEEQLTKPAVSPESRIDLYYALGKACDDIKEYEKSFQYYSKGNAIRRVGLDYNADSTTSMVSRGCKVFTPELFREKANLGCPSADPIFVVSLQRSGSTLTEQILGSHSQIESAGELQALIQIVADDVMPKTGPDYPNGMEKLTADVLRELGEKYLERCKRFRVQGKPFFVDKNCYNIWQVGLIRLMLPNAKIIDVRRHPISACWANFTISFSHAPPLSYKLTDIGRFYYDYVRMMAHMDRVQPGKIHRVIYEHLVADLEGEVRRMLDFLELPFEQSCLEYYKTERAFNSISNEQVRQPIFKEGVERWRPFEPWLGPLKEALGPVLDAYPDVPEFPI